MYLDLDTWDRINSFFVKKGLCMSSNNDKQAMVPLGAEILINEVGTAPGLVLEHNWQAKLFCCLDLRQN